MESNQMAISVTGEQPQAPQVYTIPPMTAAQAKSPTEPNNRFMRNTRPNYFRRQEKKNGKDWIDKAYNHLDKDIPIIVMDFINGNISDADVMYLFNPKFWFKFSNVVYDKFVKTGFRVEANRVYADYLLKNSRTIPQYFIGLRNADENEFYVWRDFQLFLETFGNISKSPNGGASAIKYTFENFIPTLARYKGVML